MELQQLRYLVAVARTGNFSRAAEQCHVSQPSLSQQVQKLEDELGERLFSRLKRRSVPTAAGEALLLRAARILGEVDAAHRDIADASGLLRGRVSVGVLPTIAPYLLPPVLSALARDRPGLEVEIHEDRTAELLSAAAACELDLAVLSLPVHDDRFVSEKLFEEELLLALPPGHRLEKKAKVGLADLEDERFILMKEGHCLGDQALRLCDRHGLHPQVVLRSAQLETVQALVRAGVGISLVPAMARDPARPAQPVFRSLAAPRPKRVIGVVRRKEHHHSKAAQEFLRHLRLPSSSVPERPPSGRK